MASIDSEQERKRLEWVYAEMNEGELRAIAADRGSLTADAVRALSIELSRRALDLPVVNAPAKREPAAQAEFTTRKGIVMFGIFVGVGIALILLVLRFPQWFSQCVRVNPDTLWR